MAVIVVKYEESEKSELLKWIRETILAEETPETVSEFLMEVRHKLREK